MRQSRIGAGVNSPHQSSNFVLRWISDNFTLIADYKRHHEEVWPEITKSILDSGIMGLKIHLLGTRMSMIMEANESFPFEAKAAADRLNPKVQQWKDLMWRFQQALPQAAPGQKWILMDRIFRL
jgi:L-rhamnose mutarotase